MEKLYVPRVLTARLIPAEGCQEFRSSVVRLRLVKPTREFPYPRWSGWLLAVTPDGREANFLVALIAYPQPLGWRLAMIADGNARKYDPWSSFDLPDLDPYRPELVTSAFDLFGTGDPVSVQVEVSES